MKLLHRIFQLLFPPKCVLCRKLLTDDETDLCHSCRTEAVEFSKPDFQPVHLATWTALWYYEGTVRSSILRFKFHGVRSYASIYGRLLAMKLLREDIPFDILTWVPISPLRKWLRGYDQVALIAQAVGSELGITPVPTLYKRRHNRPQSRIRSAARRRANVLNAYRVLEGAELSGKRILLLDDILTTGSTVSECAKTLLLGGAKQVSCAAVAAASHKRKNQ